MKRLFTFLSLFCMTLFAAHAQSVEFRYHGQALEDEATITIDAEPSIFHTEAMPDYECNTNPIENPQNGLVLVNLTNRELKGTAVLDIEKNTLKPNQIQWCMGGACQIMKENSLDKSFTLPASGTCPVQLDCDANNDGEMEFTLQTSAGGTARTVTIRFVRVADRIQTAKAKNIVTDYYTLDGRRVATQPMGVSLARYADGTVRKVVKK